MNDRAKARQCVIVSESATMIDNEDQFRFQDFNETE